MSEVFLIDKSALARVSRSTSVQNELERLDGIGELATNAVTELELGYSARNLMDFDAVDADRRALYRELPITLEVTTRARAVQRELVVRGHHRGPGVPDLLIAATAEIHGATVVHYDRDFDVIAAVTGQPAQWIVPAGSVP